MGKSTEKVSPPGGPGLVLDDKTTAAIASGAPLSSLVPKTTGVPPAPPAPKADADKGDDDKGDGTRAAATEGDDEGGDGEGDDDKQAAVQPTAAESAQAQITALNDRLVDTRVELGQMKAERDALSASQVALLDIARAATNKMQVALGGPAMDLDSVPAEAVTTQYRALEKKFNERFRIGGTAQVPNEDTEKQDDQPNPARIRAVRLRPVAS